MVTFKRGDLFELEGLRLVGGGAFYGLGFRLYSFRIFTNVDFGF